MTHPPYLEHHPGPRGRRAVRRFFDYLEALLAFLLEPCCDLLTTDPKDKT